MRAKLLLLALLCSCALPAAAQVPPGVYVTEGGWGTLDVKPGGRNFEIDTVGANGHVCEMKGTLRGTGPGGTAGTAGSAVGRAETDEKDKPCTIRFTPKDGGIDVAPGENGACSYFCGMRAGVAGVYFKPAPGCSPDVVAKGRASFKRLYDQKAYAQARDTLAPFLERCVKTMVSNEADWIRNDLSITLYRLKDYAGCLKVLQPLAEQVAMTDAQIKDSLPPFEGEQAVPVARAARTNLRLCKAGR